MGELFVVERKVAEDELLGMDAHLERRRLCDDSSTTAEA